MFTCKLVLKLLNIKVVKNQESISSESSLLVANHLSYIDALVLFSHYPSLFITSQEMRETFLLGKLASLGGCFFVERRKDRRTELTKSLEMESMKKKMDQNFNVFLFPEGTSSDGSSVLPFKATFFQLALDHKIKIRPLIVKYEGQNRALVPWYGEMTFFSHLLGLCRESEIKVRIQELEEVRPEVYSDRFILAASLHSLMKETYEQH